MASAGPNAIGTVAEDTSYGTNSWTSLSNAIGDDGSYARGFPLTYYLKATNFGFSIPAGATIDGIVVEFKKIEWLGGALNSQDSRVRIVKGGTIGSTDKASGTNWPTTGAYVSHGGAADLWGETWASTDINASTFGTAISATGTGSPRIDHVRITVYYTEAATFIAKSFQVRQAVNRASRF